METKLIGKDKLGEAAELIVSGELVAVPDGNGVRPCMQRP